MRFKLTIAGDAPADRAEHFLGSFPRLVRGMREAGITVDFATDGAGVEHHKHPDAQPRENAPLIGEPYRSDSMSDELPDATPHAVRSLVADLRDRVDFAEACAREARENHESACVLVADMHAAALGERGRGPIRGVVEDIEDLRSALHAERAKTRGMELRIAELTGDVGAKTDSLTAAVTDAHGAVTSEAIPAAVDARFDRSEPVASLERDATSTP